MRCVFVLVAGMALIGLLAGDAVGQGKGAKGKKLNKTPAQTEGPFYPDKLPPDTDNDLVVVNGSKKRAKGVIAHLSGRVLDTKGRPIRNAVVEIWQVDGQGIYLHSGSHKRADYDKNFQGFGRCITGPNGVYHFRTLKPVPYTFRTPHIHFIVKKNGKRLLTTQIYIRGEKLNEKDGIFKRVGNAKTRGSVVVAFRPLKGAKGTECTARFNIVVGLTPEIIDND